MLVDCLSGSAITTLNLANNELSPEKPSEKLCEAIAKSNISSLNVSYNSNWYTSTAKLTREWIVPLLDLLAENGKGKLKVLDLSHNSIGDEDVETLRDFLTSYDSLEELRLNNNLLTDDGAEELASAFEDNSSLRLIDLK